MVRPVFNDRLSVRRCHETTVVNDRRWDRYRSPGVPLHTTNYFFGGWTLFNDGAESPRGNPSIDRIQTRPITYVVCTVYIYSPGRAGDKLPPRQGLSRVDLAFTLLPD
jgi:hypothetical protein